MFRRSRSITGNDSIRSSGTKGISPYCHSDADICLAQLLHDGHKAEKKTLSIGHQNNPTEFKQFIQSRPQRWVQRGEHSIFPSGYSKPALRAFFSTSAGLAPLKLRVLLASTTEAPNRSRAVIEARVMFFIGKQFLASIYHFHANSRHYFKNLNHSYR